MFTQTEARQIIRDIRDLIEERKAESADDWNDQHDAKVESDVNDIVNDYHLPGDVRDDAQSDGMAFFALTGR